MTDAELNQEISNAFSFSNFASFLGDYFNQVSQGLISDSERLAKLADAYRDGYLQARDVARNAADRAALNGDARAASVLNGIADAANDIASKRALLGDRAFLSGIVKDARASNAALAGKVGPIADMLNMGIGWLEGILENDWSPLGSASSSALGASAAAYLLGGFVSVGVMGGLLLGGAAVLGGIGAGWLWNQFSPEIISLVSEYFQKAGTWLNLRDPLALDLNGDGIATISANEGIMFDHNNAGIRYGTGWINPNDGWLALDRNGNGKIDSGRELFGDSTRKLDGNFAAHAYDALKSFDTNNDGKVDMADATGDTDSDGVMEEGETYWDINNNNEYDAGVDKTFADLRVWVDANSNAVTDSGELKTLSELGIVSIGTGKTTVNATDEHGNVNTFKGNYTTTSGEVIDGTRSFNLLENKFNRDTVDHPNIPPDVAALPNMQGSGAVRNLHEAMSLGTPQSLALKTTVQAFNNATTRGAQYALIDKLLLQTRLKPYLNMTPSPFGHSPYYAGETGLPYAIGEVPSDARRRGQKLREWRRFMA